MHCPHGRRTPGRGAVQCQSHRTPLRSSLLTAVIAHNVRQVLPVGCKSRSSRIHPISRSIRDTGYPPSVDDKISVSSTSQRRPGRCRGSCRREDGTVKIFAVHEKVSRSTFPAEVERLEGVRDDILGPRGEKIAPAIWGRYSKDTRRPGDAEEKE